MSSSDGSRLPEISEAQASGFVAQSYADIRAVTGAPMVNLVYRHLAVRADRLADAWSALRPAFVDGRVEVAAGALAPTVKPLQAASGSVDDEARDGLARTLQAYGRANRLNLIAFSMLLGRASLPAEPRLRADHWPLQSWPASLPPVMQLDQAPADTLALLYRLARADPLEREAYIPTIYRHLAHWPPLLELLWTLLQPRYDSGEIDRAAETLRRDGDALAAGMDTDGAIAASLPADVSGTVDMFCGRIAEILVVIRLVERV